MAAIFNAMTTPAPAPRLRGIFDLMRDNPYNLVNNSEQDDGSFYASHMSRTGNSNFDYLGRDNDTGTQRWGIRQGSFLENLNKDYDNVANFRDTGSTDNTQRWRLDLDHSKLPKTRFGGLENVIEVTDANRDKIIDKRFIYNDPNYGEITFAKNYKRNKFLPLLPAIVGMGMGGMLGAAGMVGNGMSTASGLFKGAQGMFNGGNPLAAIASAGLGFAGVPAFARPFLNMAISQMIKNKGKP